MGVSLWGAALSAHDPNCVRCGYKLHGLPHDGNCPECGLSVTTSLRGFRLSSADPAYIAALKSGATLIVIGQIAQLSTQLLAAWASMLSVPFMFMAAVAPAGTPGVGPAGATGATGATGPAAAATAAAAAAAVTTADWISIFEVALRVLSAVSAIVLAWGFWRLTEPDPGYAGIERGASARRVVRVSSVVLAVVSLASVFVQLGLGVGGGFGLGGMVFRMPGGGAFGGGFWALMIFSAVVGLLYLAAICCQFFGSMRYVRWLAPRIPNPALDKRAKLYTWLLPLIFVVGSCLIIGPLIAAVLLCRMTWVLRSHMVRIQREQLGAPGTLGTPRAAGA